MVVEEGARAALARFVSLSRQGEEEEEDARLCQTLPLGSRLQPRPRACACAVGAVMRAEMAGSGEEEECETLLAVAGRSWRGWAGRGRGGVGREAHAGSAQGGGGLFPSGDESCCSILQ